MMIDRDTVRPPVRVVYSTLVRLLFGSCRNVAKSLAYRNRVTLDSGVWIVMMRSPELTVNVVRWPKGSMTRAGAWLNVVRARGVHYAVHEAM